MHSYDIMFVDEERFLRLEKEYETNSYTVNKRISKKEVVQQ